MRTSTRTVKVKKPTLSKKEKELEKLLKGAEISFDLGTLDIKYLEKDSKKGFAFLAGINRTVKPSHVTTMVKALYRMKGTIRPVTVAKISFIDGSSKYYIIDGQHLYTALLRTNSRIPYRVVDIKDKADLVETIALCNATSKSWTLGDYITAWSSINPNYITLNQLIQEHDIEARTIVSCYMNVSGRSASQIIKTGKFVIEDKAEGDKLLRQLSECLDLVPRGSRWDIDHFANAALVVMRSNKHYNHNTFLDYLRKNKKQLAMLMQDTNAVLDFLNQAFKK